MQLVRRDPGVAYLDTHLWLPKTHTSDVQVRSVLTYVGRDDVAIEAWFEERHHFRVPRNFLPAGALGSLPYPVYDARFRQFPRVSFESRVKMDAKDPSSSYQAEGSDALLDTYDGILCLRCGAGKTVVSLHTAAKVGGPILVVVDDVGLAEQWLEEIEHVLGIPPSEVGKLWGSKRFDWKKKISVATIQSLAAKVRGGTLPPEMPFHYAVILLDEAHVVGAPFFNTGIPPFHGRRWGLSATPDREDEFDSLLKYTVGPVVFTYLIPESMPEFWFLRTNARIPNTTDALEQTHDTRKKFHHLMTYGYLAREDMARTKLIVDNIQKALDANRQVLVLSHSRDMVEILGEYFPDGGVTHGGVKGSDHWEVVKNCNPVIAIMKRGAKALNKPSLDTLFICDPFAKVGVLQQTMGRLLRSFSGKKGAKVIVIEDRYIKQLKGLCGKMRKTLARWPAHKGGRIPYKMV